MTTGTPTTRRYPRSLAEAFPDERAPCLYVGSRPMWWRLARLICSIAWRSA